MGAGGGREKLKREGTYVYRWLIHIVVQQKPTRHCKAIILQWKKQIKKKNRWASFRGMEAITRRDSTESEWSRISYAVHQMVPYKRVKVLIAQSCPALCDPMDCSPSGSSVHGVLQTRILEWVAVPFSRESSQSRN